MTHNTREVEGLSLEIGGGTKATLYVGLTLEKRHLEIIDQALHHQLQKAREEAVAEFAQEVVNVLKILETKHGFIPVGYSEDPWNSAVHVVDHHIRTLAKEHGIEL